jgi:hypothetical protein
MGIAEGRKTVDPKKNEDSKDDYHNKHRADKEDVLRDSISQVPSLHGACGGWSFCAHFERLLRHVTLLLLP